MYNKQANGCLLEDQMAEQRGSGERFSLLITRESCSHLQHTLSSQTFSLQEISFTEANNDGSLDLAKILFSNNLLISKIPSHLFSFQANQKSINHSLDPLSVDLHKSYFECTDVPQVIFWGTHLYLSYRPENIEMESDSDDKAS